MGSVIINAARAASCVGILLLAYVLRDRGEFLPTPDFIAFCGMIAVLLLNIVGLSVARQMQKAPAE